jgi:hypothetical protein
MIEVGAPGTFPPGADGFFLDYFVVLQRLQVIEAILHESDKYDDRTSTLF